MDTIFFILSKVVQFCIEPLNWVMVWLLLALLFLSLRKPYLTRRFILFAVLNLFLVGYLPASEILLRTLEESVPPTNLSQLSEKDLGGIVILGGAIGSGTLGPERNEVSIGAAAERLTKSFELIRSYPNLPFIFTGFSGSLSPTGVAEADAFKRLAHEQGLKVENGIYENQSRNTYENARFVKPLIVKSNSDRDIERPWLLISSASHMPRAIRAFQKQGIEVLALPVDYQTGIHQEWISFNLVAGAQNWNNALHELIGLLAYWITGKI
jgi:uncharacterized SAM-binding protein YcdF (DUF218 family)